VKREGGGKERMKGRQTAAKADKCTYRDALTKFRKENKYSSY
jgi:hypothetical protein